MCDRGPTFHEQLEDASLSEDIDHATKVTAHLERWLHPGVARGASEHHAQRLAKRRGVGPSSELRVIGSHRASSDEDRIGLGAKVMDVCSRLLARDPLRRAVACGGPSIEGHGELEHHERATCSTVMQVGTQRRSHLCGSDTDDDLDARFSQPSDARSCHLGVRILDPNHDACDAGLDDRIDARRGAAMVTARFERGDKRCAVRSSASCVERHDLGVTCARRLRRSRELSRRVLRHENRTDPRVGRGRLSHRAAERHRSSHQLLEASFIGHQVAPFSRSITTAQRQRARRLRRAGRQRRRQRCPRPARWPLPPPRQARWRDRYRRRPRGPRRDRAHRSLLEPA